MLFCEKFNKKWLYLFLFFFNTYFPFWHLSTKSLKFNSNRLIDLYIFQIRSLSLSQISTIQIYKFKIMRLSLSQISNIQIYKF